MAITNLLGPSKRQKESNKGVIDWSIVTVGDNLTFEHSRGMPDVGPVTNPEAVPWGDRNEDVVILNTVGYTGMVTVSSGVVLNIIDGVIKDTSGGVPAP